MAIYAAYGSNLDPEQMHLRCPHSPVTGTGWIEGWRLTFGAEELGWEGALATVVEAPGEHVFVALYDLTDADARTLDAWEGADTGLYRKIKVRVHTLDGSMWPGSTSSTATRAACRRPATWACSRRPRRAPARRTTTSPSCAADPAGRPGRGRDRRGAEGQRGHGDVQQR